MFVETEWREPEACSFGNVLGALLKSSFYAVSISAALSILFGVVQADLMAGLGLAFVGSIVHLGCMLAVGCPFFYYFWRRPWAAVWKWPIAIPMGFLLGGLPIWVLVVIYSLWSNTVVHLGNIILPVGFFGVYGMISAIASVMHHRAIWSSSILLDD